MASPRVVLATASGAQAAVALVGFGLPAIGPELRAEYGLGLTALGAVLTASVLGSGLLLVPAGIAVDRFGVRPVMLLGTAVSVGGLIGAVVAPSPAALIGSLIVSGAGSAVIPIAGMGAVFGAFASDRRAWALGVRQMALPLGGVMAAVVLPPLAHAASPRVALFVPAGALAVLGTAFALVGDGASRVPQRPALRRVFRLPGLGRLLGVAGIYIVVLQAAVAYTVPAARDAGLSAFAAGAVFFVFQVSAGVGRVAWGWIADRDGGRRRVRTLAEVGWAAACGGGLFALALHAGPGLVIPAAAVFAFGALGWNALVYTSAGELGPPELAGQAVAVAATLISVASAAAGPPLGALAEHAGWDALWAFVALLALAGALLARTLGRVPQLAAEPAVADRAIP